MGDHPQLPLACLHGVFVDAEIRPLIEFLNRGGWRTVYSCQGAPGRAAGEHDCPYVMFASVDSLAGATPALADVGSLPGTTSSLLGCSAR